MASSVIEILLKAKDTASKAVKGLSGALGQTSEGVRRLNSESTKRVTNGVKLLTDQSKKAGKELATSTSHAAALGGISVAGLTGGMGELADTASDTGFGFERTAYHLGEMKDKLADVLGIATSLAAVGLGTFGSLAFGYNSLQRAGEFRNQLAEVYTLTGNLRTDIDRLGTTVLGMGNKFGRSFKEITPGLYQAISGIGDLSTSVAVLDQAVASSIAGVTSIQEATSGLITVMNAYGLTLLDVSDVSDSFFTAVRGGVTTFGELSAYIGTAASTAKAAGVDYDELLAAVTALTKGGIGTAEAFQGLRAILVAITRTTPELKKAFAAYGGSGEQAIRVLGLKGALEELKKSTGDSVTKMVEYLGAVEAVSPALALLSDESANFTEALAAQEQRLGATEEALAKVTNQIGYQLQAISNRAINFGTAIADATAKYLHPFVAVLGGIVDAGNALADTFPALIGAISTLAIVVGTATTIWWSYRLAVWSLGILWKPMVAGIRSAIASITQLKAAQIAATLTTRVLVASLLRLAGITLVGWAVFEVLHELAVQLGFLQKVTNDYRATLRGLYDDMDDFTLTNTAEELRSAEEHIGDLDSEINRLSDSSDANQRALTENFEKIGRALETEKNRLAALKNAYDSLPEEIRTKVVVETTKEGLEQRRIDTRSLSIAGLFGLDQNVNEARDLISALNEAGASVSKLERSYQDAGEAAENYDGQVTEAQRQRIDDLREERRGYVELRNTLQEKIKVQVDDADIIQLQEESRQAQQEFKKSEEKVLELKEKLESLPEDSEVRLHIKQIYTEEGTLRYAPTGGTPITSKFAADKPISSPGATRVPPEAEQITQELNRALEARERYHNEALARERAYQEKILQLRRKNEELIPKPVISPADDTEKKKKTGLTDAQKLENEINKQELELLRTQNKAKLQELDQYAGLALLSLQDYHDERTRITESEYEKERSLILTQLKQLKLETSKFIDQATNQTQIDALTKASTQAQAALLGQLKILEENYKQSTTSLIKDVGRQFDAQAELINQKIIDAETRTSNLVIAGLISEREAAEQVTEVREKQLQKLRELIAALQKYNAEQGKDPGLENKIREAQARAGQIQIDIDAESAILKFQRTFADSVEGGLRSAFTAFFNGEDVNLTQAFQDIFRNALSSALAEVLSKKITEYLVGTGSGGILGFLTNFHTGGYVQKAYAGGYIEASRGGLVTSDRHSVQAIPALNSPSFRQGIVTAYHRVGLVAKATGEIARATIANLVDSQGRNNRALRDSLSSSLYKSLRKAFLREETDYIPSPTEPLEIDGASDTLQQWYAQHVARQLGRMLHRELAVLQDKKWDTQSQQDLYRNLETGYTQILGEGKTVLLGHGVSGQVTSDLSEQMKTLLQDLVSVEMYRMGVKPEKLDIPRLIEQMVKGVSRQMQPITRMLPAVPVHIDEKPSESPSEPRRGEISWRMPQDTPRYLQGHTEKDRVYLEQVRNTYTNEMREIISQLRERSMEGWTQEALHTWGVEKVSQLREKMEERLYSFDRSQVESVLSALQLVAQDSLHTSSKELFLSSLAERGLDRITREVSTRIDKAVDTYWKLPSYRHTRKESERDTALQTYRGYLEEAARATVADSVAGWSDQAYTRMEKKLDLASTYLRDLAGEQDAGAIVREVEHTFHEVSAAVREQIFSQLSKESIRGAEAEVPGDILQQGDPAVKRAGAAVPGGSQKDTSPTGFAGEAGESESSQMGRGAVQYGEEQVAVPITGETAKGLIEDLTQALNATWQEHLSRKPTPKEPETEKQKTTDPLLDRALTLLESYQGAGASQSTRVLASELIHNLVQEALLPDDSLESGVEPPAWKKLFALAKDSGGVESRILQNLARMLTHEVGQWVTLLSEWKVLSEVEKTVSGESTSTLRETASLLSEEVLSSLQKVSSKDLLQWSSRSLDKLQEISKYTESAWFIGRESHSLNQIYNSLLESAKQEDAVLRTRISLTQQETHSLHQKIVEALKDLQSSEVLRSTVEGYSEVLQSRGLEGTVSSGRELDHELTRQMVLRGSERALNAFSEKPGIKGSLTEKMLQTASQAVSEAFSSVSSETRMQLSEAITQDRVDGKIARDTIEQLQRLTEAWVHEHYDQYKQVHTRNDLFRYMDLRDVQGYATSVADMFSRVTQEDTLDRYREAARFESKVIDDLEQRVEKGISSSLESSKGTTRDTRDYRLQEALTRDVEESVRRSIEQALVEGQPATLSGIQSLVREGLTRILNKQWVEDSTHKVDRESDIEDTQRLVSDQVRRLITTDLSETVAQGIEKVLPGAHHISAYQAHLYSTEGKLVELYHHLSNTPVAEYVGRRVDNYDQYLSRIVHQKMDTAIAQAITSATDKRLVQSDTVQVKDLFSRAVVESLQSILKTREDGEYLSSLLEKTLQEQHVFGNEYHGESKITDIVNATTQDLYTSVRKGVEQYVGETFELLALGKPVQPVAHLELGKQVGTIIHTGITRLVEEGILRNYSGDNKSEKSELIVHDIQESLAQTVGAGISAFVQDSTSRYVHEQVGAFHREQLLDRYLESKHRISESQQHTLDRTTRDMQSSTSSELAREEISSSQESSSQTLIKALQEAQKEESKPGYAWGGYITGPGSDTSDSIDARLSNGEYVLQAKAVKHYGLGVVEAFNRMVFDPESLAIDKLFPITIPRKATAYASGGQVASGMELFRDSSPSTAPQEPGSLKLIIDSSYERKTMREILEEHFRDIAVER